jgi:hypothetical protein
MGNDSNPKKLTASATTTLGSVMLYAICINKTLAGTITVNEGNTNVAIFATTAIPGTYHLAPNGVRYGSLAIALSGADDVTVLTRAI